MKTPRPDEVDRLVAAWARERPDLDTSPLHVLSRVTRLGHHLERARAEAFAATELVQWEFDVLAALRRSGAPHELSPSSLAAATLVTSGTMTTRIDRLAARALVERRPDPADRRGVIVRLTEEGVARVDTALADLLARERSVLDSLEPEQAEQLAVLLRRLLAPFEA
ncbi:transcriptional regulator, MarR family [Quadrisphaera granulorum]|uniref:MarR family transcriptional regulator n=1 Tax=Quadrisphaera granulorum TaxID=317664 RepID=A0A316AEK7_9ACTN|nr:MarR family transcriptional regulator [Quadrisphaera granulorum]PWJ56032.1 MarR family transcriptional regulator [Quadrisphaera granulorum]SZE94666.1 transcriptional regulator, MarR family [Quadrisphaera granulorum]